MATRRKYLKRDQTPVIAVQLSVETEGFTYRKWGAIQTCKAGDWVVNNQGDVYSVDQASFAHTYTAVSPGLYRKSAPVWAEVTSQAGAISTKEGVTNYEAGAYLVFNEEDGGDGYAVTAAKFKEMYAPAD
ncbi:MAG: hypothetical protein RIS76_2821 [Verrucomicrobiota bacterium]|jgi:hypothetical protein